MAEFKLGRLRFVWKGAWADSTDYVKDDVIRYGGKSYVCLIGHNSNSNFYTDLNNVTPYWGLMNDGQEWKNNWSGGIYYKVGDIVRYGGRVYQCNTGHTSQSSLESDQAKWDIFINGFEWKGDWVASGTIYKINDVVKYGGDIWICTTPHTSGGTFSLTNFTLFVQGLQFEDSWNGSTSYQIGDVVTYGGYSYISVTTNNVNNTPSTSIANWDVLTTGFKIQSDWSSLTAYKTGDVVRYGGYSYVAKLDSTNTNPAANAGSWDLLTKGFDYKGNWANATVYKLGDVVFYAASSHIAILEHTSNSGTNRPDVDGGVHWAALTEGSPNSVNTTRGDLIVRGATIDERLPVGTDGQVLRSDGTDPVWSYYGIISKLYYVAPNGTDSVEYGNSIDKPWKTIAYACQRINNGAAYPNAKWLLNANKEFMKAEVDNFLSYTYKVSITGTSGGAFTTTDTSGLNAGMPIRFSNQTGSLTLNAASFNGTTTYYVKNITTNTSFTVSATHSGVALTAAGTGTADGKYYYDSTKAKRDADYAIDAAIYDLTRDGTSESVINAKSYFSDNDSYITTAVEYGLTQFVGSLNYLSTLAGFVLANTAPTNNYQTLNGVGSPVSQTINLSYTSEAGANTGFANLIGITTGGLTAGTQTAIPAPVNPNITVNIKTGTYSEVLPISVPAFTSLVGDELRTTVVQPYTFNVTAVSSSGTSLVVSSAAGILNGMGVYGHRFIPDGTTVTNVVGTTVTLSQATTGSVSGTLTVGYTMSNMFYMRNGTGARNMTVTGLYGGLTAANPYGTKRPTAGAYFSLDPGAGTDDETVWITSRSPYMQNVTLFGTGCTGLKVDGSLHAGGNKSIVANDFTNVLSDGIAIWCSNLARVEAVSVFSYYGYAGYLSETGGHIRATNGNSSYGTYGTIAEGTNPLETAITGTVNTRTEQAKVTNVLTGGGAILWLEYSNAGETYSSAAYTITSGSGAGATVASNNYYTNAINEVRLITGGAGYISATNVGQTGTTTTITIAASDTASTNAYNGMRVLLTAGTGAGQYGFINKHNASNKQCIVLKESFTPLTTSSSSTTVFNVTSTATLSVGTPIVFTGTTFGGVSNNTVYWIIASNFTGTTFSISSTQGGSIFSLSAASGTMQVYVAGWDVAVVGTSVAATLDGSTRYSIEPRVTFSGTGTGALARATVLSNQISAIRIINPGSGYTGTPTMTITDPNATTPATWTVRTAATGVLGQPTWTSRGTNYTDASVTITGNGYADYQASGYYVNLSGLTALPVAGSNITFAGNSNYYIIVQVLSYSGTPGNYSANLQINPGLTTVNAPAHSTASTITIQYSQVRLTGHDFLYVGSGNFFSTGYPNNFSTSNFNANNQTVNSGGGRVFFTSTDQDGNFNVGNLFLVQQATGVATLSANLFNLSGLNQLQFASGGALVTQFSTDGNMTANSDNLVPTQRAIRAYVSSQLGAGGSNIAANSITAGNVYIGSNNITTVNGVDLNINAYAGNKIVIGTQAQISVTPSAANDIANKTYVDSKVNRVDAAKFYYGTM